MSAPPARVCGSCSLCCFVLRVDELAKLGGRSCMYVRDGGGCAVHERRPEICRAYRCAWLQGAFNEEDRPDALGAVLDWVPRGDSVRLLIRQAKPDAFDRSLRLQQIAEQARESGLVEIRDVEDVMDPDRPFRVLEPDGTELRIAGSRIEVIRDETVVEQRRVPLLERAVSWLRQRFVAWRLSRWPTHEERAAPLGRAVTAAGTSQPGDRSGDRR